MKNILILLILFTFVSSCKKEDDVFFDLRASVDEITRLEIRADHKTMIANNDAKMQFYPIVYGTKTLERYVADEETGQPYKDTLEIEYEIPLSQLPANVIKLYEKNSNKEVSDFIYSAKSNIPGSQLTFYAEVNGLKSNELNISVREIPDESYDEIVIPVIFHIVLPPPSSTPTYEISVDYLEKTLKRVNDIFNRRVTTDPNGGNAKITFKLAQYNGVGVKLQEAGKDVIVLSKSDITAIGTSTNASQGYRTFMMKSSSNRRTFIWDPEKYLNIWVTKFYTGAGNESSESYSFQIWQPKVMHSDYELTSIPGLDEMVAADIFSFSDVTDPLDVGIMLNFTQFLNPQSHGINEFSVANVISQFLGLLPTKCGNYNDLNSDGDNDYCSDTYNYEPGWYATVFKANNLYKQPEEDPTRPKEWFTSFNVIDYVSRKNSISVDQATRMRKVLLQCPSRWMYKSDFALTGK